MTNTTNLYEVVGKMIFDDKMSESDVAETLGLEIEDVRIEKQIAAHARSGRTSMSMAEVQNIFHGIYVPTRSKESSSRRPVSGEERLLQAIFYGM